MSLTVNKRNDDRKKSTINNAGRAVVTTNNRGDNGNQNLSKS